MPAGLGRPAFADRPRGIPVQTVLMTTTFVGLLTLTVLGPFMTVTGGPLTGEGSPVRQGAYVLLLLLALVAARPLADRGRLLVVPVTILAALGWCALSLVWAIEPGIATRRLVLTAAIIWTAFIATNGLRYERALLLIRVVLLSALIGNYLVVLLRPDLGIHMIDEVYDDGLIGDWRGFMEHKNFAGALCGLTVIAFAFDGRRIPRWLQIGVAAAAGFFLLKTQSRTSVGVCLIALAAGTIFRGYRARYRSLVLGAVCVAALVVGVYVSSFNDLLLRNLNEDTLLTGRPKIWLALLGYSDDNPVFGAGFGSFWNIGSASPIYKYGKGWVPTVASGHNGFLDLLVTIGAPGLLIVLAGVVVWPLVRLFSHPGANGPRGAFVLACFMFCVAHNGTETSLFDRDAIPQVFLMISIALLWQLTAPLQRTLLELGPPGPATRRPAPA